jgi:hypothetical protein
MTNKKTKKPWFKFEPGKWVGDQQLRGCSLAARGLWIEMLCIMHRAEPYGHLLHVGKKPSDEQLAGLVRAGVEQVRSCLLELEAAQVFSRTRGGTIYSRRMTHDEQMRVTGVKAREKQMKDQRKEVMQDTEKERRKHQPQGLPHGLPGGLDLRDNNLSPSPSLPCFAGFSAEDSALWKRRVDAFYAENFWLGSYQGKPGSEDYIGPKELIRKESPHGTSANDTNPTKKTEERGGGAEAAAESG